MLRMDTNVMNFIQVGFDCLSLFDTKGKDGYECYEFDIGWVSLFISWIQNLRMDTNVMNLIQVGFDCLSHLDTNVKDGFECYQFDIGWL